MTVHPSNHKCTNWIHTTQLRSTTFRWIPGWGAVMLTWMFHSQT